MISLTVTTKPVVTTTNMSSFDFIANNILNLPADFDFSLEEYFSTTKTPTPDDSTFFDMWNAIPTHQETTVRQSSAIGMTSESSASEFLTTPVPVAAAPITPVTTTPAPTISASSTPTSIAPAPLPLVQEPAKIVFVPFEEAINRHETAQHHKKFAEVSMLMHGAPKTMEERWILFGEYLPEDIFRVIYYLCYFKGYGSLTVWQRQFLEDYAKLSPKICQFCSMPSNYWCDTVAKIC